MILIDTSCWTHALRRKGDDIIRAKVRGLLESGEAAWCDVVRLELWNGAASDWDRQLLRDLEIYVPSLPITQPVWDLAIDTGTRARLSGLSVPVTDLLIFACGRTHNVPMMYADRHFEMLEQLK